LNGIDWSALGIKGTPKPSAPKTYRGKKQRFEKGSQEEKDKAWEQRALKRMREKHEAAIAEMSIVHQNLGRFLRTLKTEEKGSQMDRFEQLDWDACELVHVLKLPELPEDVRRLAFKEFAAFLRKVKRRVFGDDPPLPPFEKWKDTDFEMVKGALGLK
jgi:hypothetical protein